MADPFVAEIRIFPFNFAPKGWAFCNGQLLPLSQNTALFSLLGTTYGGDGEETFNLPNLASRVPIHMGTGKDGITYQIGEMAGTEQETLTIQQIPVHNHPYLASTNAGTQVSPNGNVMSASPTIDYYVVDTPTSAMNAAAVQPVGGSQPHENTQPFLCINFIISLFGRFPSQT